MRIRRSFLGLAFAVLALISQLAVGSFVLPDADAARTVSLLQRVVVMCRADAPVDQQNLQPTSSKHTHQRLKNVGVPLSLALSVLEMVLPPNQHATILAGLASAQYLGSIQARAPPARAFIAGYPRGPPFLN